MPKLRVLGSYEIIGFLKKHGFFIHRQKGSHIILQCEVKGEYQTLTVPNHYELDRGMTKGIYNQCKRYVELDTLDEFFYTG